INYDLADESSVYSTLFPSLKKLDGAEPVSGPKTIKSILKSRSTFKTEALKGVIINKPSSAPAKVDNIIFAESERYPPDEYLHPYEPSQRYQPNSRNVSFIESYECPEPVDLEIEVSSDQNGQADQNDQLAQTDEISNDDQSKHSNHTNDELIIDNLPSTKDIQMSKHILSKYRGYFSTCVTT
nr:hypothetical protein [Tanacetum cinerariifolium]